MGRSAGPSCGSQDMRDRHARDPSPQYCRNPPRPRRPLYRVPSSAAQHLPTIPWRVVNLGQGADDSVTIQVRLDEHDDPGAAAWTARDLVRLAFARQLAEFARGGDALARLSPFHLLVSPGHLQRRPPLAAACPRDFGPSGVSQFRLHLERRRHRWGRNDPAVPRPARRRRALGPHCRAPPLGRTVPLPHHRHRSKKRRMKPSLPSRHRASSPSPRRCPRGRKSTPPFTRIS